jgi:hypothetical protein
MYIFVTETLPKLTQKTMSPLIEFVKNGISVLSDAARGEYRNNNEEMDALGKELFKEVEDASASSIDKKNIYSDSMRVASDARRVIANYQL